MSFFICAIHHAIINLPPAFSLSTSRTAGILVHGGERPRQRCIVALGSGRSRPRGHTRNQQLRHIKKSCADIYTSDEPKQTIISQATRFLDVTKLLVSTTLSQQKIKQVKLNRISISIFNFNCLLNRCVSSFICAIHHVIIDLPPAFSLPMSRTAGILGHGGERPRQRCIAAHGLGRSQPRGLTQ